MHDESISNAATDHFRMPVSNASFRSKSDAYFLILIVLLAFGIRLYWMTEHAVVITTEGADYARQGENFLHGNGFRGIMGHQELLDPPGYALLIAGVTFLIRNSETATKVISLLLGVGLILPLYFLCLRVYGRITALFAAGLVAVHPIFVGLSSTAYSETVYIPLVMSGIFFGLVASESSKIFDAAMAGICFACAYLTRQEAIPFLTITSFWILFHGFLRRAAGQAAVAFSAMILAFALLAAPYVIYLSVHTGHFRIEAKNGINYLIAKRQMEGIPHRVAAFGIDENLNVQGPMLDPNKFIGQTPSMGFLDLLRYARSAAFGNARLYFDSLLSIQFGSPFLLFLAFLGLFQNPWDVSRLFREAFLVWMFSYVIVILLLAHMYQTRYSFIVLPFLTIWASNGLAALMDWGTRTAATLMRGRLRPKLVGATIAAVAVACVVIASARGIQSVDEFAWSEPAYLPVKIAGLWLRNYQPGPKSVMADASAFPYYAGGTQILFPVADAAAVLRYIERKNPDFVVMYTHERWASRTIASWFDDGIPDPRAQLVYDNGLKGEVAIRIYKWSRTRADTAAPAR
jgi:4-amino-4-deoxy-L-arabinose transferase-like glycosyltransferase